VQVRRAREVARPKRHSHASVPPSIPAHGAPCRREGRHSWSDGSPDQSRRAPPSEHRWRPSRVARATCMPAIVARRRLARRRSSIAGSPRSLAPGDTIGCTWRLALPGGAAIEAARAAPPGMVERHAKSSASLDAAGWGDMSRRSCRPARPSGATWQGNDVASLDREGRHASTRLAHVPT
jgi:hypothetical protein